MSVLTEKEINNIVPENTHTFVTDAHGHKVQCLLTTLDRFRKNQVKVNELLFEAKAVSEFIWERLNTGKWADVPLEWKQAYSIASGAQVVGLLREAKPKSLSESIKITDMGILLGFPIGDLNLVQTAELLSEYSSKEVNCSTSSMRIVSKNFENKITLENEVDTLVIPSLERFLKNHFQKREPVRLKKCLDHWPALKLWQDLDYIKRKAGQRIVPIELGKTYTDSTYSQKLMKVADFIDQFVAGNSKEIGYLAQHQLFEQVPELKKDVDIPLYCACSDDDAERSEELEPEMNAWFGPGGTVSPLHHDPKHNLLCQVAGSKLVSLYSESDSPWLYPLAGILGNTSHVDVESPDLVQFPLFARATKRQCLLGPGQALYIPPRCWHHVRALDTSFSVSFWWD